jgi:predicted aconitase
MQLTPAEQAMLAGAEGPVVAEALDYIVQFGEAFDAPRLVDIAYCHYPAEMAIYEGQVEGLCEYAERGGRVRVPTTTSTLCCDLERTESTGIPAKLAALQSKVEAAHRSMGIMETYTCTPQHLGFIPPFGSLNALVESSAIVYYNSVLGARTNRGGLFTRYSAITGKYPLMGYLLDENRRGTHLFHVEIPAERLASYDAWCALGFHIGSVVGSGVPVIAFQGEKPQEEHRVTVGDLGAVYEKLNTIAPGNAIDFVTLGCPHYTLEQLRILAGMLSGRRVADGVRFWVCTNRMTRSQAKHSGYVQAIEDAGALVVADTCPVESHLRASTCREHGLSVPNVQAMVTDSAKMARYVGDLIGCRTALAGIEQCVASALSGR